MELAVLIFIIPPGNISKSPLLSTGCFFSIKLISLFTEEKILCCLHASYLLVLPQLEVLSFSSSFLSLASYYPQGIIRYKNQTKQRSFSSFFNRFLAQECQHAVSCFILKISVSLFFPLNPKKVLLEMCLGKLSD